MRTLASVAVAAFAVAALLFWSQSPALAEPFDCTADDGPRFEVTELEAHRHRCAHFDPCRQPFFGTTHLHPGLSFDASIGFVDYASGNDPRGAYQFAHGKSPITLPNIIGLQGVTFPGRNLPPNLRMPMIDRPTDWGGVTDHSEHFGEMGICKNFLEDPEFPNPPGRFSLDCRMLNGEGESHFEDVSVTVAPVEFAPPAPPLNMAEPMEVERAILCTIPSEWVGDWHRAPRRQFYIQLSGNLEVAVSDGEIRKFSAGSFVLLEDTTGKGHLTRVVGDTAVDAVFVQLPVAV